MEKSYTTKEIQNELLVLLNMFNSLCLENNIKYTLHAGTLIGAVREKGFIPWDDDADIGMTRDEFERLKKIENLANEKNIKYDFLDDKIKKVWLHQADRPAVWIDIFIYDYISEKKIFQKLKRLIINILTPFSKNAQTFSQFKARKNISGIKRFIYCVIYYCSRIFPLRWRNKIFDSFTRYAFTGKKQYIQRANDQYTGMYQIYDKKVMESFHMTDFENSKLMITDMYDEILKSAYGDYMKPVRYPNNIDEVHNLVRDNSKK